MQTRRTLFAGLAGAALVALWPLHGAIALRAAPRIAVTPGNPTSTYAVGRQATWKIEIKEGSADKVSYVIKSNGLKEVARGEVALRDGAGSLTAALAKPGTLLVELSASVDGANVTALTGAAFDYTRIAPTQPTPADFQAFWKGKLAELAQVPANPVLEPVEIGDPSLEYSKIRMDNIRGTHIYGQVARPKEGTKFPALLIVQWAGVYPLQRDWVTWRAKAGWLVLDIEAHDLPFDQPQSFYDEASRGPLANYPAIGCEDRETSYFLRMYLSCYRAAEYLVHRPDWDGKVLVVTGGSQGGLQTIVTAGIHPRITAAIAEVPAGCDPNGPLAERSPGWPQLWYQTQGRDADKVHETSRYFDVVNFARQVKCPTLVGLGLVDTTCPAPGVFAAFNQLRGPKEVAVMPQAGHGGDHSAYGKRSEAWFTALVKGLPAPVGK